MPSAFRKFLIVLLVLAFVLGGYFLWRRLDDRAAERDWAQYVLEAKARGVKLTAEEFFVTPAIPERENFAASPMWQRAFAVGESGAGGIVPEMPRNHYALDPGQARHKLDLKNLRKWMAV